MAAPARRRVVEHPDRSGLGGRRSRVGVARMQRLRLLASAVASLEEHGYAGTTVAQITARARISRRTFYELFANVEECLAAVLEDVLQHAEQELANERLDRLPWLERMRLGLWWILCLVDSEPGLAKACFVHSLHGGPAVSAQRERIFALLTEAVGEGRSENARAGALTPLTAEGLVGASFSIVQARLARGGDGSLRDLHGELLAMIVLPYLGAGAARRAQAGRAPEMSFVGGSLAGLGYESRGHDLLDGAQMRLTYRTVRVLQAIAEHPSASNREIAQHAGIQDQGQVSKLLARLQRIGLLTNDGAGHAKGEPNAWTLTHKGERVVQSLHAHTPREKDAA